MYSFLSQVLPYQDHDLERLYSFGRFLSPHLALGQESERVKLGDEVSLEYYRLQRIFSDEIPLGDGDPLGVKSPTDVGTGKAKEEKAPLSLIIETLNARFGTNFSEEERLFFEQITERAAKDVAVINTALSNPFDHFKLAIKKFIDKFMIECLGQNETIVTNYMEGGEFQQATFPHLAKAIFDVVLTRAGRQSIEKIIAGGEGNTVEFKSTLRVNLEDGKKDPVIEYSALKTVAAFLNSPQGGALVIGVQDNGEILGVETDGFGNEDKMNLHLVNLIKKRLGQATMLHIKIRFESIREKRVMVVDCAPSGSPVFYKDGNEEKYFIRSGASTDALSPSQMSVYIKQRFG